MSYTVYVRATTTAAPTRLGLDLCGTRELARLFCLAATGEAPPEAIAPEVASMRRKVSGPAFCYTRKQLGEIGLPDHLTCLLEKQIFADPHLVS